LPAKLPKDGIVSRNQLQEDFGDDILNVLRTERNAAKVGRVMNDVIEKTQVTIHEIVPGTQLVIQAAVEKGPVDGCQCHG
jgi:hypothetical protein